MKCLVYSWNPFLFAASWRHAKVVKVIETIYKDEKRGIKNATSDMKILSFMHSFCSQFSTVLEETYIKQTKQNLHQNTH